MESVREDVRRLREQVQSLEARYEALADLLLTRDLPDPRELRPRPKILVRPRERAGLP